MSEPKFLSESEPRNVVGQWAVRLGLGGYFVVAGLEKFSSDPGSHWVGLFHEIGFGDWFRYFTGFIEVLGGFLMFIPRTALLGLALLAVTMAAAVLILALVIGRPADGIFPGIFLIAIIAVGWNPRNR